MGFNRNLKKVGDVYHYRFRMFGQIHHGSTHYSSYKLAEQALLKIKDEIRASGRLVNEKLTVCDLADKWLTDKVLKDKHRERAEYAFALIKTHLGHLRAGQVTSLQVEKFKAALLKTKSAFGRPYSESTVNATLRYLSILFAWGKKFGLIRAVPFHIDYLKPKKKNKPFLTLEQLDAFLAAVDVRNNLHASVAIRAQLYLGLRESESLNMRWENFSAGMEDYTPTDTKGGEADPIPMRPELLKWIRKCRKKKCGLVIAQPNGKPHVKSFTRKHIKRAGAAIGLPGLHSHALRASFATILADGGTGGVQVQQLMRHKDQATTQVYLRRVPMGLREAVNRSFDRAHRKPPNEATQRKSKAAPTGKESK